MVDRYSHKRHIPFCPTQVPMVNQYMWPEKDTNEYLCVNGLSHAIYACDGSIARTLPLEMWPRVNEIHPQIAQSRRRHFALRSQPARDVFKSAFALQQRDNRLEGMYRGVIPPRNERFMFAEDPSDPPLGHNYFPPRDEPGL